MWDDLLKWFQPFHYLSVTDKPRVRSEHCLQLETDKSVRYEMIRVLVYKTLFSYLCLTNNKNSISSCFDEMEYSFISDLYIFLSIYWKVTISVVWWDPGLLCLRKPLIFSTGHLSMTQSGSSLLSVPEHVSWLVLESRVLMLITPNSCG